MSVAKRTGYQETTLTLEAQVCKSSTPCRVTRVDDRFTSFKVAQQRFFLARRITLDLHQFGTDVSSSRASSKKQSRKTLRSTRPMSAKQPSSTALSSDRVTAQLPLIHNLLTPRSETPTEPPASTSSRLGHEVPRLSKIPSSHTNLKETCLKCVKACKAEANGADTTGLPVSHVMSSKSRTVSPDARPEARSSRNRPRYQRLTWRTANRCTSGANRTSRTNSCRVLYRRPVFRSSSRRSCLRNQGIVLIHSLRSCSGRVPVTYPETEHAASRTPRYAPTQSVCKVLGVAPTGLRGFIVPRAQRLRPAGPTSGGEGTKTNTDVRHCAVIYLLLITLLLGHSTGRSPSAPHSSTPFTYYII